MKNFAPYAKAITAAVISGLSVVLASAGDLGWDDGLSALIAFLVVVYAINLMGTPPPSVTALVATAVIGTLVLLAWMWWVDRHRVAVTSR